MSALKYYTHSCRECKLTFRLLIKPDQEELFKIRCPDCRARVWLDNRDGGLGTLKRKRLLSRPIRQYYLKPGVDYIDPEPEPPPPLELTNQIDGFESNVTGSAEAKAPLNLIDPTAAAVGAQVPANDFDDSDQCAETNETETPEDRPGFFQRLAAKVLRMKLQLQGHLGAAAAQLYLARYTILQNVASRTNTLRSVFRAGFDSVRARTGATIELLRRSVFAFFKNTHDGFLAVCAWSYAKLSALLTGLKVYGRSLNLRASRSRRFVSVRWGDLGPAIRRRLEYSQLFPRVVFERVSDAGLSILDNFQGRLEAFADSENSSSRSNRYGRRLEQIRRVLWPDNISRPVLLGAYVTGPIAILALYIAASFLFPVLALPETFAVFEARLQPLQPNRILDRDGALLAELFARKTSNIQLAATGSESSAQSEFPDTLKQKLLFVEDETFYEHGGIRPLAILRAFFRNIMAGRYVEGGSTITQQVARVALRNRNRSLTRKFQEAVLCRQLEEHLSKDEILTAYINHVYMGHGAYGMQVAAGFFFDRPLTELNFAEELMLVTVLPAPTEFSPLRNPARLEQRMDLLYNRMVREDFRRIPADRYRHQKNQLFAGLLDQSPNQSVFASRTNHAPYVAEYVRMTLRAMARKYEQVKPAVVSAAALFTSGENATIAPPTRRKSRRKAAPPSLSNLSAAHIAELFQTGVTIQTSIDPALQLAATAETPKYIGDINPRYPPYQIVDGKPVRRTGLRESLAREYSNARLGLQIMGLPAPISKTPHLQAAAIGIEPRTGAVLFMQGGAGFRAGNQLNHAISMRRQTGSAIKPFVYSAAIESGRASPATILDDKPYPKDGPGPKEDPEWKPRNYKDDYHGKVSVRFALQKSLNIPAIELARRTGMSRLALQFQKFFFPNEKVFRARFRRDLTVAIGSLEMSPLEMAVAYTAFGNNGVIRRPHLIQKIVARDGTVLFSREQRPAFDEFNLKIPEKRRVLSGDVAHVMASLLKDSARRGGAGYWSRFTLGKTGTSNQYRDAWFVGVLPGVSAAVWVGYDQPTNSMGRATGSAVAGPLWARIIGTGMRNRSPGEFRFDPQGVYHTVCTKSGGRATAQCLHTKKEIFARAHPPGKCWKHGE